MQRIAAVLLLLCAAVALGGCGRKQTSETPEIESMADFNKSLATLAVVPFEVGVMTMKALNETEKEAHTEVELKKQEYQKKYGDNWKEHFVKDVEENKLFTPAVQEPRAP